MDTQLALLKNMLSSLDLDLEEINSQTEHNGIVLTAHDLAVVQSSGKDIVRSYGRVALNGEVIKTLLVRFSDSPFIQRDEYVNVILEIYDIFQYVKKELDDAVFDEELIEFLYEAFNGICQGSVEYLGEKVAYDYIQNFEPVMRGALDEFLNK